MLYLRTVKLLLTTLCFLVLYTHASAQGDLLVLKQRDQTIQTWMTGSVISFQYSSKQWIQGIIKKIYKDSLLIEQINVIQVANQFGFASIDTAKMGLMRLQVKEIYGMPKKDYAGIITNGALLKLGSAAYMFLNITNTLIHKEALFDAANGTRLGIAGGVFLLGTILGASHKTYITLGKKYRMEIVHI
jgi:hypothetical protein